MTTLLIELRARERLAKCYGAKGEFDKALDQVNQIYAVAPGGQKALWAKLHIASWSMHHQHNRTSALKLLREIAEQHPNSQQGHEAMEILEHFKRRKKEMDH